MPLFRLLSFSKKTSVAPQAVAHKKISAAPPAPQEAAPPPTLGDVLHACHSAMVIPWDQLTVGPVVARGAFGRVSKAKYNFSDVAIKELHSGGHIGALLDELESMRKLHHPNLLATIGLASDFINNIGVVMEFLPASLYSLLHSGVYHDSYRGHLTWARCATARNLTFSSSHLGPCPPPVHGAPHHIHSRAWCSRYRCFLALSTDVARGFEHLHGAGFAHRDLKPGNVLVSAAWQAKVADFGEAQRDAGLSFKKHKEHARGVRVTGGDSTGNADSTSFNKSRTSGSTLQTVSIAGTGYLTTATGTGTFTSMAHEEDSKRVHGTAPYLSPEAASAGTEQQVDIGRPTDVWGFGCLLAHIAVGAPPYSHIFTKPREVVHALRDGSARPLCGLTSENIPDALRVVAEKCCTWEPEGRPTFAELGRLLGSTETVREVCGPLATCEDDASDGEDSFGDIRLEAARPEVRLRWLTVHDKKAEPPPAPVSEDEDAGSDGFRQKGTGGVRTYIGDVLQRL